MRYGYKCHLSTECMNTLCLKITHMQFVMWLACPWKYLGVLCEWKTLFGWRKSCPTRLWQCNTTTVAFMGGRLNPPHPHPPKLQNRWKKYMKRFDSISSLLMHFSTVTFPDFGLLSCPLSFLLLLYIKTWHLWVLDHFSHAHLLQQSWLNAGTRSK